MVQQVDQPANRYVDVWATMINNEVRLRDGWVPPMGVAVLRFPLGHPYRGNLRAVLAYDADVGQKPCIVCVNFNMNGDSAQCSTQRVRRPARDPTSSCAFRRPLASSTVDGGSDEGAPPAPRGDARRRQHGGDAAQPPRR